MGKGVEVEEAGDDNKAEMLPKKEMKIKKRTRLRELGPVDSSIRVRK